MEPILGILTAFGTVVGAIKAGTTTSQWLVNYLRERARKQKTAEVLAYLRALGLVTEAHVAQVMDSWKAPESVTPEMKEELRQLLVSLVKGARFHTTNGSPRSVYLRCERLIEELLRGIQPVRKSGEAVANGVPDWKLERFLGMGSFGEVWMVGNQYMPQKRACKFFTTPDGQDWIKREANALFHIKHRLGDHPNVVEYHDIAVNISPHPYLSLEYVLAGSLEEWILSKEGDRAPGKLGDIIEGIARGISRAHEHKIYHRDLKPANILLTNDNPTSPKITDFGLSRVEALGNNAGSSASQASTAGTSMYMPPEAADPYAPRKHAQDDVFAFGVIWFQMLLGKLERPAYDFAEQLRDAGIDSRTIRLVTKCLAHPSRRFADGCELFRALEDDGGLVAEWTPPEGCFDVGPLVREYLDSQRV